MKKDDESKFDSNDSFFENIYNKSAIGFYRTTPDGKIVKANPTAVKLLGFDSLEELANRNLEQESFTSDYPRDEFKKLLNEKGAVRGFEAQWVRKDGQIIYVRKSARVVRDNEGTIIYYDGTIEDISARKKEEIIEKHLKQVLLAIRNVNQLIVNEDNIEILLQKACENLTETLGYFKAWIVTIADNGRLDQIYACGLDDYLDSFKKEVSTGFVPQCVKEALTTDDVIFHIDPTKVCRSCILAESYKDRANLSRRLVFDNRVYGVLVVSIPAEFARDKEEIDLFVELAGDISFALHKIYLQKSLKESEVRYKQFVETANEAVVEVDNDGIITFANKKFNNLLGYPQEQIIGKRYEIFVHPDDLALHREMLQKRKQDVKSVYEKRLVCKDGTTIWTIHSAAPSYDDEGRIVGAFGMITDITEIKNLDQKLQKQNRFLATLLNNLPGVVYSSDFDKSWPMRYLSDHIEDLTGYKPEELVDNKSLSFKDVIVPEYRESLFNRWKQVLSAKGLFDEEYEIVTADGSRKWVWERGVGIFNDMDELERLEGFIMDVTASKHNELKLAESEHKYRSLAESIDSIIWEYDIINDKWTYVAPQVKRILGYQPSEWTNLQFWTDNLHPEDREWASKYCLDCTMRGEKHSFEYRFKHKKGRYVWLRDVVSVELKDGKPINLRGFMVDIDKQKNTELALQKQKNRLETFFNIVPDYLLITDANYNIVKMSKSWEKLLGLPLELLEYQKILDFIHPDDVSETKKIISNICTGQDYDYSINRYKSADGSYRYLEWFSEYSDGLVFAIARDVTDKKQESNLLQELISASEEFLQQTSADLDYHQITQRMLELSGGLIAAFNIYEGDQGDFRTVALVGMKDILHKAISFLRINPEGRLWKHDPIRAVKIADSTVTRFESMYGLTGIVFPKPIVISLQKMFNTGEAVVVKIMKENRVFGDFTIIMPAYSQLQNIELIEVYARQVGLLIARVNAELSLKRAKDQLQAVINTDPSFIFVKNCEGKYLMVNKAMADSLGLHPTEIIGKTDKELWPTHDFIEGYIEADKKVIESNEPLFIPEEQVYEADGTIKWFQTYKIPFEYGDTKTKSVLGVGVDITSRKESDEAFRQKEEELFQAVKMSAIGRLAGGIAHDFNNLLHAIIGYSDMALASVGNTNDSVRTYLNEIKRAGKSSADLTKQLLAFARRQTYNPVVVNLNDAIEEILVMLKHVIDESIEFEWKPAAEIMKIKIDPTQLQQVLINLVVNARDALDEVPDSKITIETTSVQIDEDFVKKHPHFSMGRYDSISVADNGCGINKELQTQIFEPFFTTKETGKGTGLGLATVYGIVRQNEGIITLDSEVGKGSTFTIYFPERTEEVEPAKEQSESYGEIQKGSATILLVEDDEVLLSLVNDMLTELGYTVMTFNKPLEALEMIEKTQPPIDLLITDVIMPGMNGKELWLKLKMVNKNIHCLFISGYTANIINHDNIIDYDVHFLQKPFSIRKLSTKIQHILNN